MSVEQPSETDEYGRNLSEQKQVPNDNSVVHKNKRCIRSESRYQVVCVHLSVWRFFSANEKEN